MFLHERAAKATAYASWVPLFDDETFFRAIWELRTDYRDRITRVKTDQYLSKPRSTILWKLHVQRIHARDMWEATESGVSTGYQAAWDSTLELPPAEESFR